MSQGTFPLSCSQSGQLFSDDLNSLLIGINSTNSGPTAPTSGLQEGTLWLDTSTAASPVLKIYDDSASAFIVLGVNGDAFRTVAIYKNGSTAPAKPTTANTVLTGTLEGFTVNGASWSLVQATPSSGEDTFTSIGTFKQVKSSGDYVITNSAWAAVAQLSGNDGSTGARSPIIGFYVPMVTRNTTPDPDTFTSPLANFNPDGLLSTNTDNQNYLDASFSQFFFGNLTSDAVEGDYGVFYNNSVEAENIVASYDAASNLWVTGTKKISGNLLVDGSITTASLSATAITGKTVSGGKSSLTDTTSGFFLDSTGAFVVGGDTNNQLKWDGSNLTIPAATVTGTLTASDIISSGTITANEIATGTITADLIEADSITADKIASLELSVTKNISVGSITVTGSGSTELTEVATLDDTTIVVDSVTGFPDTGVVLLNGTENFNYTSRRLSDSAAVPPVTAAFISTTDKIAAASFPIGTGVVGGLDITFLTVDTTIGATTISVDNVSGFSDTGTVFLDGDERFTYDSRNTTLNTFSSTLDTVGAVHLANVLVTGVYEVTSGTGVILEGTGRFSVGSVDNSMTFDGTTLTISGVDLDASDLQNLSELDGKISSSLQTYSAALSYDANAVVISANRIFRANGSVAASNPPESNIDNTSPFTANTWSEISADTNTQLTKAQIDALDVDAGTVDGKTVGKDVPTNAVFTDTQLTKAQIDALDVDAGTVDGKTVGKDVPTNAVFTDTQLTKAQIDALDVDAGTVDGKTVGKDVPTNAVFTDTQLTKAQIDALDVDAGTVDGKTVGKDVPTNAVFTDTNTQLTKAQIDALDVDAGTVDGKTVGKDVPTNAVFTDTQLTKAQIDALDVDAGTVDGKTVGKDVPTNAVFTDTQLTKAQIDALDVDAGTVDGKTVGKDVPTNAVFTDTQLTKAQIDALDVDAGTVDGKTVGKDVPTNAVFTDTQLTKAQIDALDVDAGTVDGKTVGKDVPTNAVFTDTQLTKAQIDALDVDAGTVDGKTVGKDVPTNAVFTDTTVNVAIALTGDVTGGGTTSFAATIGDGKVAGHANAATSQATGVEIAIGTIGTPDLRDSAVTNVKLGDSVVNLEKIAVDEMKGLVFDVSFTDRSDSTPENNGDMFTATTVGGTTRLGSGDWNTVKSVRLGVKDGTGLFIGNVLDNFIATRSYIKLSDGSTNEATIEVTGITEVTGSSGNDRTGYFILDTNKDALNSTGAFVQGATYTVSLQTQTDSVVDGSLIVTGSIEAETMFADSGTFGQLAADSAVIGTLTTKFLDADLIIVNEIEAGSITADKIDVDSLTVKAANVIGEITVGSIRDTDGAQLNFQEYLLDGSFSGPNAQPRANALIPNESFTLSGGTATVNVEVKAAALGRFARPVVSTATDTIPVSSRVVEFGYLGKGQSMYGRGYTNGMYNTTGGSDGMYRRTEIDLVSDYSVIDPSALFDFGTPNLSSNIRQQISVRVTADAGTQVRFNVYGQGISEIIRFNTSNTGTIIPTTETFEKIENIIVLPIFEVLDSEHITGFAVELDDKLHTFSGSAPTAGTVLVTVEGY